MNLIGIYRSWHQKTAKYTFFLSAHGAFSRTGHTVVHKISLNKFKKVEIIPSTFSDHTSIKLEINYRKKTGKSTNMCKLNNVLLKKQLWTSLVVQWLRLCLPMQGTWVRSLVWEDPTCHRATKPLHHNYWACVLEPTSHNYWACAPPAHTPQLLRPRAATTEARTL